MLVCARDGDADAAVVAWEAERSTGMRVAPIMEKMVQRTGLGVELCRWTDRAGEDPRVNSLTKEDALTQVATQEAINPCGGANWSETRRLN